MRKPLADLAVQLQLVLAWRQHPVNLLVVGIMWLRTTDEPADYDFSRDKDKQYWNDCCADARKSNVIDSDCSRPQW